MEQLTERISEKLRREQIQPNQRPYHVGGHIRAAIKPECRAYNVKTLEGNWSEEQADSSYHPARAFLRSDLERLWQSEYSSRLGHAYVEKVHREVPHLHQASQCEHLAVQTKLGRAFPGHQPERDCRVRTNVALSGSRGLYECETAARFKLPELQPQHPVRITKTTGRKLIQPVQDQHDTTEGLWGR